MAVHGKKADTPFSVTTGAVLCEQRRDVLTVGNRVAGVLIAGGKSQVAARDRGARL